MPESRIPARRPDRPRPPRAVPATDPVRRPPGRVAVPPAVLRPAARSVRVRDRQPPVRDRHRRAHRPRPRRLRPSRLRLRRLKHRLLRRRRSSRRVRPSRPPRRHPASRRPSSRRSRAPPRHRAPVPCREHPVSPVRGRISVRTRDAASRRLVPTSPVVPTVRRVPRPRLDPPPPAPPRVRVSPDRGRVPVAPVVCPAARRARAAPAVHRDRVTTRSLPPRAWASRGLPARPAAMPPVRVDLVRPPAAAARVAPAVPVGRVPVGVAVCPACRARTRP